MAIYTRVDLRNAVLQEIGVLDGHGVPSPQDAKLADDRCQQQLEFLYDQGWIPFDLEGDIPARFFIPLIQVIALPLSVPFGVVNRSQLLAAGSTAGMELLSKLKAHRYMGDIQQSDYF